MDQDSWHQIPGASPDKVTVTIDYFYRVIRNRVRLFWSSGSSPFPMPEHFTDHVQVPSRKNVYQNGLFSDSRGFLLEQVSKITRVYHLLTEITRIFRVEKQTKAPFHYNSRQLWFFKHLQITNWKTPSPSKLTDEEKSRNRWFYKHKKWWTFGFSTGIM